MEKCSELERWKEKELNMRKMTLSITLIISLVATTAILLLSFSTYGLYNKDALIMIPVDISLIIGYYLLKVQKSDISLCGWFYTFSAVYGSLLMVLCGNQTYMLGLFLNLTHPFLMTLIHAEKIKHLYVLHFLTIINIIIIGYVFAKQEILDGKILLPVDKLMYDAQQIIVPGLFAIALKILELAIAQKREKLLHTLNKQISEESEAKESFFSSMSHEMRNPLASLLGTIDLLILSINAKQNSSLNKFDPELLRSAKFSGEILLNLIGNILDFSKIRTGKMIINEVAVDLREKCNNVVSMFIGQAEKNKTKLEYMPDNALPPVLLIDYNKLNQVLLNLIGNSIKFAQGGRVLLKTTWFEGNPNENLNLQHKINELFEDSFREEYLNAVEEDINIQIITKNHKRATKNLNFGTDIRTPELTLRMLTSKRHSKSVDYFNDIRSKNLSKFSEEKKLEEDIDGKRMGIVLIEVIDTGIGISKKNQDKLFQPFVQATKTTSKTYGGTGLGLWVSKGLINLMNGEIKIESEEGVGCNFMIAIPLIVETEVEIIKNPKNKDKFMEKQFSDLTCLYVEDQVQNHPVMLGFLNYLGIKVELAYNGKEGLQEIKGNYNCYDLIITDLRMPIMSGQQMISEIRKYEKGENYETNIKIIVLSGEPSENEESLCLHILGANDYLTKPVSLADLYCSINKIKTDNLSSESSKISYKYQNTILIIDDDKFANSITKQFLDTLELTILQAYSITQGIQIFGDYLDRIGIIIQDSHLKDGTGREALFQIRNIESMDLWNIYIYIYRREEYSSSSDCVCVWGFYRTSKTTICINGCKQLFYQAFLQRKTHKSYKAAIQSN